MFNFYNYTGDDKKITQTIIDILCDFSSHYKLHYFQDGKESEMVTRLKKSESTIRKTYQNFNWVSPSVPRSLLKLFVQIMDLVNYMRFVPVIEQVDQLMHSLQIKQSQQPLEKFSWYFSSITALQSTILKKQESILFDFIANIHRSIQVCEENFIPRGIHFFKDDVKMFSREVSTEFIVYSLTIPSDYPYQILKQQDAPLLNVLEGTVHEIKKNVILLSQNEFPYIYEKQKLLDYRYLILYSGEREILHIDGQDNEVHLCLETDELNVIREQLKNKVRLDSLSFGELLKTEVDYNVSRDSFSLQKHDKPSEFWEDFSQDIINAVKEINWDEYKF